MNKFELDKLRGETFEIEVRSGQRSAVGQLLKYTDRLEAHNAKLVEALKKYKNQSCSAQTLDMAARDVLKDLGEE